MIFRHSRRIAELEAQVEHLDKCVKLLHASIKDLASCEKGQQRTNQSLLSMIGIKEDRYDA